MPDDSLRATATSADRLLHSRQGAFARACGRFLSEQRGQDIVEYALLASTIGIAGAAVWSLIGVSLGTAYDSYDAGQQGLWEPPGPPTAP